MKHCKIVGRTQLRIFFAVHACLIERHLEPVIRREAARIRSTPGENCVEAIELRLHQFCSVASAVLAGKADKLLGPDVQRAIAANYPGSKVVELDWGHELLVEKPYEAARHVAELAGALPG